MTDLCTAIGIFCEDFRPASDPSEVGAELVVMRSAMDRLEQVFSQTAATFAATDEYENQGATSPIEWLRHNARMTSSAAAEKIAVGEQLEKLPQFTESLFEGRLGFGHLAHAAHAAQKLHDSTTGSGFDESDLLEQAEGMSVGKFGYAVRHYLQMRDPKGAVADEVTAAELREASITTGRDGWVHIRARLDPQAGAIARTVIENLARRTGADDTRLYAQRTADALVEALLHKLQTGDMPQRGGQRAHLQVTASLDTLLAKLGAPGAELAFGLPISAEAARRVACDCALTRILLNSDSIPIDVGREKRIVPGATRKALHQVYPECGHPGCERPASWTEAHHIIHWIDGGPTIIENLVPLCYRHHFMVHEGGWTPEKTPGGTLRFIPPSGNSVRWVPTRDNLAVA